MPIGGEKEITGNFNQFLKVGEQDGKLVLWTENYLDDKSSMTIPFVVVGTGWEYIKCIDGTFLKYIDTIQMSDGLCAITRTVLKNENKNAHAEF